MSQGYDDVERVFGEVRSQYARRSASLNTTQLFQGAVPALLTLFFERLDALILELRMIANKGGQ